MTDRATRIERARKRRLQPISDMRFEPCCCRVCGAVMVPHLVWPDAPARIAGLCETHFRERLIGL